MLQGLLWQQQLQCAASGIDWQAEQMGRGSAPTCMLQDLLEQQAQATGRGCSARHSRCLLEPLHLCLYEGRQLPVLLGHLQAEATMG